MDAVFFSVKQAHLGGNRFCRRLLGRMGLTPARFDMLVAIGAWGKTQCEVRRALGVARSTVSELVDALVACGLVRRTRAVDRRTWNLRYTARGRELVDRAYGLINDGFVPLSIDSVLTDTARFPLLDALTTLGAGFGRRRTPDLYVWHPDDWLGAVTWPGEECDGVPFVT